MISPIHARPPRKSPRDSYLAVLFAAACTPGDGSDPAGTTTTDYPPGTCREILDAEMPGKQDSHPVDSFWFCPYTCGIAENNDTLDIALSMSRMSYDQLGPGQPDGCHELRTALYQCFDALTCAEVAAFREASNAGTDGPCIAEYFALEPHIPECGI